MALNARRHTVPAGTDQTVNRATIFETFGQSIHDVVPVASLTDQAILVSDMQDAGVGPSTSSPLVTVRADAPGLHRMELTTDGATWVPVSGVLRFADDAAKDAFTASNPGLFSLGDRCFAGTNEYRWNGTTWANYDTGWVTTGLTITPGSGFSVAGYELSRRGGAVSGVVTLTRTGTTVTPDSSGNFADLTGVLTMPVGWRYTGTVQDAFLTAQQSGVASFFGRLRRSGVGADGQIDLTHGIPSQTLPNGQNISFTLNYPA